MSKEGKSLPVPEMDTNILFEKHTVDEIRGIEKRTRADIERKKEDLRTMVGERYRDLIEAADTIAEMKNSAQNVMATIGRIENICTDLKNASMIKGTSLQQKKKQDMENRRKEEAKFHEVSSQIKLLLDIPEKVWTCLDSEDYLSASRLYLLSQHINTSLQLNSQSSPNFLFWFPVLNRQWAAISHFKFTILQGCRQLIRETSVPDEKIAECLCSLLLLENSNPRQVFNEFLLARTSAIQQLFHGSNQTSSIKEQICTVVQLITRTIHQIYTVFHSSGDDREKGETNLLLQILSKVTSEKQCDSGLLNLHSSVSSRCLPKSVMEFCPSHKSVSMGVSESHLHDNCTQWIQTCTNDVKVGVSKLLSFVNTVKRLATIRDTVWEMMSQDESLQDWDRICEKVLNTPLHIWEDLIRPLFLDRVQALIRYQLDTTVEVTQRQVGKVLIEIDNADISSTLSEVDLGSYIWSESTGDIAPNTAWGLSGMRTLAESGGLMMKAKAYTPIVQSFCKNFDERLRGVSEDFKFYIYTDLETMTVTCDTAPFNRYSDSAGLLDFIQKTCVETVHGILEFLTKMLEESKMSLASSTQRQNRTGSKLLLTGRLCSAMCDLTPNLQQCMVGKQQIATTDGSRSLMKKSSSRSLTSRVEVNTVWEEMKSELTKFQHTAYRAWIDHLIQISMSSFATAVNSQAPGDLIRTCARWEEVSIEEETEDGKKISSKISVPMQASWYVMSMLYGLCCDLNNIGGHCLARSVLEHLVNSVSDGMVTVYQQLVNQSRKHGSEPVNQQRALQLIFDIKFLRLIIPRKDDTKESKKYQKDIEGIVGRLEEVVDPFDLDVFSPYMQANLNKLLQRTAVLLGGLTSLDKSGLYSVTSRPTSSSQQEQHNVVLLSTCHSRFSLLPLSTQQSRQAEPQPVISQTLYRGVDSSGPSLTKTAAAVIPQHPQQKMAVSSSFYDRLGTGLGSMTEISSWFSQIGNKTADK